MWRSSSNSANILCAGAFLLLQELVDGSEFSGLLFEAPQPASAAAPSGRQQPQAWAATSTQPPASRGVGQTLLGRGGAQQALELTDDSSDEDDGPLAAAGGFVIDDDDF